MEIKEININKFPVVIFSDSHCDIQNIRKLKSLYPHNQFLSLGDITDLFSKAGEPFNRYSIKYFIENNIPCLLGNHESHILNCSCLWLEKDNLLYPEINSSGQTVLTDMVISQISDYGLDESEITFLSKLPMGFKVILPNNKYYLLYHYQPNEFWKFSDENQLSKNDFISIYNIDNNCIGVIHGHGHKSFIVDYEILAKRYQIGALKHGEYCILDENGVQFKKL